MPACLATSGSVRARQMPKSAVWADDVHTFWPLITHSSPSRTARVRQAGEVGARAGLARTAGTTTSSPRSIGGRNRAFCSCGAVGDQRRPDHVDADHEHVAGGVEAALLLGEHARLDAGAALPAVLVRPVDGGPAGVALRAPATPCPAPAGRRPPRRSGPGTPASRRRPRRGAWPRTRARRGPRPGPPLPRGCRRRP